MPIYAPPATLAALGGGLLPNCDSRSLFQDRFADPQAKDDKNHTPRKNWFESLIGTQRKVPATLPTFDWLPEGNETLHARLMSRLMLNMAGGVMENAGLLLDRYGLPVIPGSAVKGCARRMALQALHDWIDHQTNKGSEERPSEDDACAPCCEGFKTPAQMFATIARVFGWVETDWAHGKNSDPKTKAETTWKSDFAWATSGNAEIMKAGQALAGSSKSFTGVIAFLSAKPNQDTKLELDVVTPHHTKYYQGENGYENAPDTEDPVPVFFPAIKSQEGTQNHFTFPLLPLRLAKAGEVKAARTWLAYGLEIFGIGAKTNAGYGWFRPASESNCGRQIGELAIQGPKTIAEAALKRHLAAEIERANARSIKEANEASRKASEDEQNRQNELIKLAAKTSEEWAAEYHQIDPNSERIATLIKSFDSLSETQRLGFLQALASPPHKQRRKQWLKHPQKKEFMEPWQALAQSLTPPVQL